MRAIFLHGWGFDASVWDRLREALPDLPGEAADRGYFGVPRAAEAAAPFVAIGHSLGAMLATELGACALVAINGFDRFVATAGRPGVQARVVERMERRLAEAPDATVGQFRAHLGAAASVAVSDPGRLRDDLALLRERDASALVSGSTWPILVLHGDDDPLLSAAHRDATFAGRDRVERHSLAAAGHLLPWTHPEWCAGHIRRFVDRLG